VQGQILAQDEAGAWGYVLPDHLGSVRQVIDAAGQVTLAQSYDPFGNLNSQHGTQNPQLPFGYTGEWYESYTQLLFLQARYCDPAVGRLLSKDPWMGDPVRPQSLNGWGYVEGNPINRVDPTGYQTECDEHGYCVLVRNLVKREASLPDTFRLKAVIALD
jgi:RHS repeat-associated protein